MEWLVMEIPVVICMVIFGGIGFYALNAKKPMHFWSGTKVKAESITNIKAYNRAHAKMWFAYDIPYIIAFFAAPFSEKVAAGCIAFASTIGIGILIGSYFRIEKKYKISK